MRGDVFQFSYDSMLCEDGNAEEETSFNKPARQSHVVLS